MQIQTNNNKIYYKNLQKNCIVIIVSYTILFLSNLIEV